jgi:superfamily II DNA or RNA helicase
MKPVLRVTLGNRWAVFHCSADEQAEVKKHYRYDAPGSQFSESYKEGGWDGFKNLMARGRVASGLFLEQLASLKSAYTLKVTDKRIAPKFRDLKLESKRPFQIDCVNAMVKASRVGGVVLMATGDGKTYTAAMYFKLLIGSAVFVCDELTLFEQSRQEFERALGERIGVVGGGKFDPRRITVATVQTLARARKRKEFRKWFEQVSVIIADEVHVAINKRNIDVITSVKPRAVFGLTATLELAKDHVRMPVAALCGPVVFEHTIQEGTEEGHLTAGTAVFVSYRDPLKGPVPGYWSKVRVKGEGLVDFFVKPRSREAAYRYRVALSRPRNDCIEALVREGLRRGHAVCVLVNQVCHMRALSYRLRDVNHRAMCGDKAVSGDPKDRIQALRDMDAGKLRLIIATGVFGKGVSVNALSLIIDGTAMPGRNGAMQRYGRGVRRAAEKERLLYVDVADCGWFGDAARTREAALLETGAVPVYLDWRGDAAHVFNAAESYNPHIL